MLVPWCQHQNLQWSHRLVTTAASGVTGFTGQSGPREEGIGDISLPSSQEPSQGSSPAITNMHTCMQLVWGVGQSSSNATLGSNSRAHVCPSRSFQSFCVCQLPKTDTGAAARRLQQSPGEQAERGPGRRQLCCSDLTGSDTTAGGQRCPPPFSCDPGLFIHSAAMGKSQPEQGHSGQLGHGLEKVLLSQTPQHRAGADFLIIS